MELKWEEGFSIRVSAEKNTVTLRLNRAGLLSLAGQLAALAEEKPGSHVHYDEYNSLETGSAELIVERMAE